VSLYSNVLYDKFVSLFPIYVYTRV